MKVIVLLSGGIDSTTCLAMAIQDHGAQNVTALTLYYGQRHAREMRSAREVAAHYGVKIMERDLGAVFTFSDSPLLAASSKSVPHGSYAEAATRDADGMSKTYVPYRNGLFLSYAAAIAYSIGATEVYYGAHADDAAGNAYPDCSEAFYAAQANAIFLGTGKKVDMVAPLISFNKAQVVEEGLKLDAPYHLTWSCYEGQVAACGKCGTCVDRLAAFAAHEAVDDIPYASDAKRPDIQAADARAKFEGGVN